MGEEPRRAGLVWPLIIVCALAIPTIFAMLLVGNNAQERADRLDAKMSVLVWAAGISMVTISASFPIRQWRRKDMTGEHHLTHDGTRIIREVHYGMPPARQIGDGRAANPWEFPGFVQAAYQAGAAAQPEQRRYAALPQEEDAEDWSIPSAAWDGDDVPVPQSWDGEIVQWVNYRSAGGA